MRTAFGQCMRTTIESYFNEVDVPSYTQTSCQEHPERLDEVHSLPLNSGATCADCVAHQGISDT